MLPAFALALLVVSGLMLDAHRRTWLKADTDSSLDPLQLRGARAQYERRMWASGVIGLAGAMLIIHPLVPRKPLWFTLYLLLLVLLCGLAIMLALVDGIAASLRVRRARIDSESLRSELKKEIDAARQQPKTEESDTKK